MRDNNLIKHLKYGKTKIKMYMHPYGAFTHRLASER